MKILIVSVVAAGMVVTGLPARAQSLNFGQLLNNRLPPDLQRAARSLQAQIGQAGQQAFCDKMQTLLADTGALPPAVVQRRSGAVSPSGRTPAGEVGAAQVPYESWLLEDSRFIPQFGEAYDAMTPDAAQRYAKQAAGCRPAQRTIGAPVAADPALLSRVFNPAYYGRYAQGVQAIRNARAEGGEAIRHLDALPSSGDGVQAYQQIAGDAARLKSFMMPAQAARFDAALASANDRVVRPALASEAQHATARAQGYEGLVALTKLQQQMAPAAGKRSAAPDDASVLALKARRAEIAASLAREERQRLDALGTGVVGLERGADWYRDFSKRYGAYADIPEIADLQREFQHRRMALLENSRSELSRRIALASTPRELDELAARYLPFDTDKRSETGTQLLTRMSEQRDTLEKGRILGRNAIAEVAPKAKAGTASAKAARADIPEEPVAKGEPTESEMYDLVKKRFDDIASQMRSAQEACRGPARSDDPGAAILCLTGALGGAMGAGEPMKITSFEKLGCERASGKPGYICDYLVAMSGGAMRAMGPTMAAMYGSGGAAQARFLKTRSGWMVFFGKE